MDFTYYERSLHISLATKLDDLRALTTNVEKLTKVVLEKSEALLADLGDKKKRKDVQKVGLGLVEKQKSLRWLVWEVDGVLGRLTTEVVSLSFALDNSGYGRDEGKGERAIC